MFIEVMYADLSRKRVPIKKAHTLSTKEVIAVIISAPCDKKPRLNGCRRVMQATGKDFVYLVQKGDFIGLENRDQYERIEFFSRSDPWKGTTGEHPQYKGKMIVFEGKMLPKKTWKKALKIFDKEMH